MPGVTRDRISAKCKLGNEPFDILDTGGIGGDVDASFTDQVHAEVEIALTAADLLLFVVDGQDGLTPVDQELARRLRKIDKPLILVVNKIDHDKHTVHAAEFSRLGFKAQLPSAPNTTRHRRARRLDRARRPATARPPAPSRSRSRSRRRHQAQRRVFAHQAILEDQRTMVSHISGTTRDAIDIPYERHGHKYVLIDTAGIRPRGKVDSSVEIFSVMRSESSIRRSDICCLVIDATMGVTAQDKKIAGLIQEASRPCVIAVNKWDLIKEQTSDKAALKEVLENMRAELFFLDYAPLMLVSAKTGAELTRLFKAFENIHRGATARIGTGVLNRLIRPPSPSIRHSSVADDASRSLRHAARTAASRLDPPSRRSSVNDDKLLVQNYRRHLNPGFASTRHTGLPIKLHLAPANHGRERSSRRTEAPSRGRRQLDEQSEQSLLTSAATLKRKAPRFRGAHHEQNGCGKALRSAHEQHGTGALDFAVDLAVEVRGHARDSTGQNFTTLGDEALEKVGIFVVERLEGGIDAPARHRAVGFAKIGAALRSLGLHGCGALGLLGFAVKRVALQVRVVLLLFEPVRRVGALLVARRDVARDGFAFGFRLGAFQDDEIAGHGAYSLLLSVAGSSSSVSPGSSSVRPKREVTGTRARLTLPCFSICDWHSTV